MNAYVMYVLAQPNGRKAKQHEKTESKPAEAAGLLAESVEPRSTLPPLLVRLGERNPEHLHYLGVSYGVTLPLYNFWSRLKFHPVYMRQTASDVTGEHTCIMLRRLSTSSKDLEEERAAAGAQGSQGGDEELGWIAPFVQVGGWVEKTPKWQPIEVAQL